MEAHMNRMISYDIMDALDNIGDSQVWWFNILKKFPNNVRKPKPDPQKIEKEGLVIGMGWKYTLSLVCRRTSRLVFD